jgi:hypothetical protein
MIPTVYTPQSLPHPSCPSRAARSRLGSHVVLVLALASVLALPACSDTAVVVALQLNRKVPEALDAVCLQVASRERERFARRFSVVGLTNTTPTLTVEQGDDSIQDFELLLRGEVSRQPVSTNRLSLSFSAGEIRTQNVLVDPCKTRRGARFVDAGRLSTKTPSVVVAIPAPQVRGDLVLAIAPGEAGRYGLARSEERVVQLSEGVPLPTASAVFGAVPLNVIGQAEGRDCDLDVLVLTDGRPELWIHQDGVFSRSAATLLTGAWSSAAVGDLRAGGGVDIALGGEQGLALLLDNKQAGGSYTIVDTILPTKPMVSALVVAHLDEDGQPDILVGTKAAADVVLINDAQGRAEFTQTQVAGLTDASTDTKALAVADIDRDGRPDVVRADAAGVTILRGGGSLGFPTTLPLPSGLDTSGVTQIIAEDLNSDCTIDLVLVRPKGTHVLYSTYDDAGVGSLELAEIKTREGAALSPLASRAAVADVNGDGIRDLVLAGDTGNPQLGSYWLEQQP